MAARTRKKVEILWTCAIICFFIKISLVASNEGLEDYVLNEEDDLSLFLEDDYEDDEYDYHGIVEPQIRGNTNFPNIRDVSKI